MSGNSVREHIEVEIAVLTGVFGFFVGGLININREILDIILSAVLSGTAVFVVTYYAMILVFSGKKKEVIDTGFIEGLPGINEPSKTKTGPTGVKKGTKIDLVSKDDDLMNNIYGKQ
jgi:hypothetical protein